MMACQDRVSKADKESARKQLRFEVEQANKMLVGQQVDFMTTMTACIFDGTNIIYTYEVDEDYANVNEIDKSMLKAAAQQIWESNPQLIATKKALKALGGKAIYNYIGSYSRKSITYSISM